MNCYGITEAGGALTLQRWEDTYFEKRSVRHHSKEIKFSILKKNSLNKILVMSPWESEGIFYLMVNLLNTN